MLECRYEKIKVTEILEEKTQFITIQGELSLPEGYPSIEKVLSYQGYLNSLVSEYAGGTLSIYGVVEAHLVYHWGQPQEARGESGFVWRGGEAAVFEERILLSDPEAKWDWGITLSLFTLEAVSDRKVRYHGELEVRLTARREREISVVTEVKAEGGIEMITDRIVAQEFIVGAQTKKEVNNQYQISYPKAPILRVLDALVNPVGLKGKASKGQVTVEGNLATTLIYISRGLEGEEGGLTAATWDEETKGLLPFQITLDLPQALSEHIVAPKVWVESVRVESSHPESCHLHILLGVRVELLNIRSVQTVLDLSTKNQETVDILRQNVILEEMVGMSEKPLVVEKVLPLPSGKVNLERILAVIPGAPTVIDCRPELDRIFIDGEVSLSLLYGGEREEEPRFELASWSKKTGERISFGEILELPGVEEGMSVSVSLGAERIRAEVDNEGLLRLFMELRAYIQVRGQRTLQVVEDCALITAATQPRPSMLFYLVQCQDTLWKIARRYNTTMEAIALANKLGDPSAELEKGRKLLIPKTPRGSLASNNR